MKLFGSFGDCFQPAGAEPQYVAECCPFCGKDNHCHLNAATGQYDCKVCEESGNHYTFIRHHYEQALEQTTDDHYRDLKKHRKLPLQTLKRFGLAYHKPERCWLLPVKNCKGKVVNLVKWFPPANGNSSVRNLPQLPLGLFGLEELTDDSNRKLILCEGPWDLIALDRYLRDKKIRARYDLLAVPGANTFKDGWVEHFKQRNVHLAYDNDEAGRKGQLKAARQLAKHTNKVEALQWPPEYIAGYDLRDLIADGYSVTKFLKDNSHLVTDSPLKFVGATKVVEQEIEWLWEGHLQKGALASFSGQMGTHKSGIARDLAARVTAGLPMPLCSEARPPASVCYLTSEDSAAQVVDLVRLAGGNLENLHILDIDTADAQLDILDHMDALSQQVKQLQAELIVVDALNSFAGGDISSDSKARKTLSGRLKTLAANTGACVLAVRNWSRATEGTGSQRSLGATSIADVGRCVLNTLALPTTKEQPEPRYLLEFEKVSNARQPSPILFGVNDLSVPGNKSTLHYRAISWGKALSQADLAKLTKQTKQPPKDQPTDTDNATVARWQKQLQNGWLPKRLQKTVTKKSSGDLCGVGP